VSARWLCVALGVVGLAGCGEPPEDLAAWVDKTRREAKTGVQPLPPPVRFEPQVYEGVSSLDPFSPTKLEAGIRPEERRVNPLAASELNRRREPLEAFPLDQIEMVGTLIGQNAPNGLVRVNRLLYRVKAGDYLGQNYGRITKIEETRIELREIVQDAAGEWVERMTSLQLQEPR
jgi:type IV pilus assembly protein PilP